MEQEIKEMLAKKDFYDILGVSKTASDDELKKSYRKLALKFHPDKNKTQGTQEVFRKVAQAYDCLSNKEKREKYDRYGSEEPQRRQQRYQEEYQTVDPQDIFNFFFGGGDPFSGFQNGGGTFFYYGGNMNRHHNQNHQQQPQQQMARFNLLYPILMLFAIQMLFGLFQSSPVYSFQKSYSYPYLRKTSTLEVKYYVSEEKYYKSTDELKKLDLQIEKEYSKYIAQECRKNHNQKEILNQRSANAYFSSDKKRYKDMADQVDLTTCYQLQEFRQKNKNFDSIYLQ